jgi:hypothetical protein
MHFRVDFVRRKSESKEGQGLDEVRRTLLCFIIGRFQALLLRLFLLVCMTW